MRQQSSSATVRHGAEDTYAASHLQSTANEAGRAVNHAAEIKYTTYRELDAMHIFVPIAIKTAGTWDIQTAE